MIHILPKAWLRKRPLNLDARINGIMCDIHSRKAPWIVFSPARRKAQYRRSGRIAGGTRMAIAFMERALPRLV